MTYLVIKALHVIFMVTWFAGLFYLPRIFVYHAMNEDINTKETFKIMERKLMMMMNIGFLLTLIFGLFLLYKNPALLKMGWMHIKLTLIVFLIIYHGMCHYYVRIFRLDQNTKTHKFYRFFNEIPTLLLFAIVFLAILKNLLI